MEPLIQQKSPFKSPPKPNMPVQWVKPELVCQVRFSEWTNDNILRQPIFEGLRADKKAKSIVKEEPKKAPSSKQTKEKKDFLTHLDKVYWPEEGYTKGDLIEYYKSISKFILPYLKDRPIVLYRFPNGINSKGFYQKEVEDTVPSWIKTVPIQHEEKVIHYMLIDTTDSLLFAANLGSIDLHPFMYSYKNLENPDYCVIDLDPQDIEWKDFIRVANTTHEILDEIKVENYCKTSGGRGLHIVIPLGGKYSVEESRQFAEIIVTLVNSKLPQLTSLERNPKKRTKKVYLDYLQNRLHQTIVAPYAVRPRPHAPVSMPIDWSEVTPKLNPLDFNIKTVPALLEKSGDCWKPVLRKGVDLEKAVKRLRKVFQ